MQLSIKLLDGTKQRLEKLLSIDVNCNTGSHTDFVIEFAFITLIGNDRQLTGGSAALLERFVLCTLPCKKVPARVGCIG